MLECKIIVSCAKGVNYGCDIDLDKRNEIQFVLRAENIDELKSYAKEITVVAMENLDHVIEKTEFDTKEELSAIKMVYNA